MWVPWIIRIEGTEGAESKGVGVGESWGDRLRASMEMKMTQKVLGRAWHTEETFSKCRLFYA